jgi:hypothetical protein
VTATTTPAATATFTINASISLTSSQGKVGATLTANMQGYSPNEVIAVTFDAAPLGSATADATGNASLSFSVPAAAAGAHSVVGAGVTNSATATYTVIPGVTLSTTTGNVGTTVTATFTGYGAADAITLNWHKTSVSIVPLSTVPATITADAHGGATATFVVPDATNGPHTVQGVAGTHAATASFSVGYGMTLSTTTPAAGDSVGVTLNGFAANSVVTIRFWNTSSSTTDLATVTVNADGSGATTIVAPAAASSASHKLAALTFGLERTFQTIVVP